MTYGGYRVLYLFSRIVQTDRRLFLQRTLISFWRKCALFDTYSPRRLRDQHPRIFLVVQPDPTLPDTTAMQAIDTTSEGYRTRCTQFSSYKPVTTCSFSFNTSMRLCRILLPQAYPWRGKSSSVSYVSGHGCCKQLSSRQYVLCIF